MAASNPASAFRRLDLPAFGRPAITTCSPSRSARPCRTVSAIAAKRSPMSASRSRTSGDLEELRVLVREVDRRLHVGAKFHHLRRERVHLAREHARQRAQRRARGLRGARRDQVRDRLRLHEVELAVVEGALGKLARPRQARAELHGARDEQVHDHRAAVAVQLEHVLAGEGIRRREVEREPDVERVAVRVGEDGDGRVARLAAGAPARPSRSGACPVPRRARCRCRRGPRASPARRWCRSRRSCRGPRRGRRGPEVPAADASR